MSVSRTTLYGYAAALGYSLHEMVGLPDWAHNLSHLLTAVAIALVGYHAADQGANRSGRPPGALIPLLILSLALVSGCQLAQMGVGVKSPTFGEVRVTIGGGVIGRPGPLPSTNLLCPPYPSETNAP